MRVESVDAVVVGAGIVGLSAARHLVRLGHRRVVVLEQFHAGHDRGSSHGTSRITRSAYAHADYVRLMEVAHGAHWPALETEADEQLVFPSPGCIFGRRDGLWSGYAEAVARTGVDVRVLSVAAAAERFPGLRFRPDDGVLDDRTAAVLAADRVLLALRRILARQGVEIVEGLRVHGVESRGGGVRISSEEGAWEAGVAVVAAGPWTSMLLPFLESALDVSRQAVAYLDLEAPSEGELGAFPVWVELGASEAEVWYGLPSFGQPGVKVAHHHVEGAADPDADVPVDGERISALLRYVESRFRANVRGVRRAERCLYTMAAGEDYILDLHPEHPNIAIGAGMSGHGFKLGPLSGQVLAELVTHGCTSIPEFERARARFTIAGHTH